jgi:hypothetical protein
MRNNGYYGPDLLDEPGAQMLADKIRRYWRAHGAKPNVRVEMSRVVQTPKLTVSGNAPPPPRMIWVVRSDIGRDMLGVAT